MINPFIWLWAVTVVAIVCDVTFVVMRRQDVVGRVMSHDCKECDGPSKIADTLVTVLAFVFGVLLAQMFWAWFVRGKSFTEWHMDCHDIEDAKQ